MATRHGDETKSANAAPRWRGFSALGARVEAPALTPGLYVVATPIGNLADITLRALGTLAAADVILAEDTRVSRRLIDRYAITTPLTPYHEHNAAEVRPAFLARLAAGEALALISDAGTPMISDPGYKLAAEAVAAGVTVTSVPGPSAALAALTSAALPTDRFFFEGFLPPKTAARRERINALAAIPATLVFYEAPSRLAEALADLATELGPRPAAVARELTKLYEETRRANLAELAARYAAEDAPKGEIVIVVGPPLEAPPLDEAALDQAILAALASLSVKDAAAAVAAETGLPRREIYARALRLAGSRR
ncbi:MAG: 16S rRNA (cytidine(1402)-2'-O)-methyltransferase [Hyphomicrobiales bacterium]|nr:16S rRNA (cytidine(1402)-2'-O)-methyltransferase [Hyphomicrobiales bacterium]MBV8663222.1 16S rRNA (cytidine(1402)-2'-O)-methyltransferase [Hyphomicrobiales bacterium]